MPETIPKIQPVLTDCNTGPLSAQAGFALRVAAWDKPRILQGGFVATARATAPAIH